MVNISEEALALNKEEFLTLVEGISREGFRYAELVEYLNASDFYTAPASTRFHLSCKGGLCQHTLNVYHNMKTLQAAYPQMAGIVEDSIRIVALFHDFAKINYYIPTSRNVKRYCANGKQHDALGNFVWESELGYTVDDSKRFLYGNHETTSEYLARCFTPLSVDESIAILHHHAGMSSDCAQDNITEIFNRNPLAFLLHMADMMSTYVTESTKNE